MKQRGRANVAEFDAQAALWTELYEAEEARFDQWQPLEDNDPKYPWNMAGAAFTVATGLKMVGAGGTRAVFALDDTRVLKLALDIWGMASNLNEGEAWEGASRRKRRWLAPVCAYDPKGYWLVMRRAKPISARRERQVLAGRFVGVGEAFGIDDLYAPSNWGMIAHRMVAIDYGFAPPSEETP